MRILCPYCGERDAGEFTCRGDASPSRPQLGADDSEAFTSYVYLRDNPAGSIDEHWYHGQGCHQWLIVRRDTLTHRIDRVRLARDGRA